MKGGERMNKKILVVSVTLLALVMLATPLVGTVMAIGPLKAVEVGKNPKLCGNPAMGIAFLDDVGPNNILWVSTIGLIVSLPDARKGSGRMNNAIIADYATVVAMQADETLYENKRVYLSGTGGEQWNDHGMLYWMLLPTFGPFATAELEQEYADGAFYARNWVGN